MTFRLRPSILIGCYEIQSPVFKDSRGLFVKNFHRSTFLNEGLETHFSEEFYTISHKNVLRGLHFQTPPHDHVKVVTCLQGQVMDAVVDLRKGSPTYGKFDVFQLKEGSGLSVYVPKGMAHGFYVQSDQALVSYQVSTEHAPSADAGILWSSAGIPWGAQSPLLSERDLGFSSLADFRSPFE